MAKRRELSEPNAGQASQNPKAATEEQSHQHQELRKEGIGEAANATTIQMAELQKSYPGCSGSSSARNGARRAP